MSPSMSRTGSRAAVSVMLNRLWFTPALMVDTEETVDGTFAGASSSPPPAATTAKGNLVTLSLQTLTDAFFSDPGLRVQVETTLRRRVGSLELERFFSVTYNGVQPSVLPLVTRHRVALLALSSSLSAVASSEGDVVVNATTVVAMPAVTVVALGGNSTSSSSPPLPVSPPAAADPSSSASFPDEYFRELSFTFTAPSVSAVLTVPPPPPATLVASAPSVNVAIETDSRYVSVAECIEVEDYYPMPFVDLPIVKSDVVGSAETTASGLTASSYRALTEFTVMWAAANFSVTSFDAADFPWDFKGLPMPEALAEELVVIDDGTGSPRRPLDLPNKPLSVLQSLKGLSLRSLTPLVPRAGLPLVGDPAMLSISAASASADQAPDSDPPTTSAPPRSLRARSRSHRAPLLAWLFLPEMKAATRATLIRSVDAARSWFDESTAASSTSGSPGAIDTLDVRHSWLRSLPPDVAGDYLSLIPGPVSRRLLSSSSTIERRPPPAAPYVTIRLKPGCFRGNSRCESGAAGNCRFNLSFVLPVKRPTSALTTATVAALVTTGAFVPTNLLVLQRTGLLNMIGCRPLNTGDPLSFVDSPTGRRLTWAGMGVQYYLGASVYNFALLVAITVGLSAIAYLAFAVTSRIFINEKQPHLPPRRTSGGRDDGVDDVPADDGESVVDEGIADDSASNASSIASVLSWSTFRTSLSRSPKDAFLALRGPEFLQFAYLFLVPPMIECLCVTVAWHRQPEGSLSALEMQSAIATGTGGAAPPDDSIPPPYVNYQHASLGIALATGLGVIALSVFAVVTVKVGLATYFRAQFLPIATSSSSSPTVATEKREEKPDTTANQTRLNAEDDDVLVALLNSLPNLVHRVTAKWGDGSTMHNNNTSTTRTIGVAGSVHRALVHMLYPMGHWIDHPDAQQTTSAPADEGQLAGLLSNSTQPTASKVYHASRRSYVDVYGPWFTPYLPLHRRFFIVEMVCTLIICVSTLCVNCFARAAVATLGSLILCGTTIALRPHVVRVTDVTAIAMSVVQLLAASSQIVNNREGGVGAFFVAVMEWTALVKCFIDFANWFFACVQRCRNVGAFSARRTWLASLASRSRRQVDGGGGRLLLPVMADASPLGVETPPPTANGDDDDGDQPVPTAVDEVVAPALPGNGFPPRPGLPRAHILLDDQSDDGAQPRGLNPFLEQESIAARERRLAGLTPGGNEQQDGNDAASHLEEGKGDNGQQQGYCGDSASRADFITQLLEGSHHETNVGPHQPRLSSRGATTASEKSEVLLRRHPELTALRDIVGDDVFADAAEANAPPITPATMAKSAAVVSAPQSFRREDLL